MSDVKYDPALCERLARETREDDARMTPTPWKRRPWPEFAVDGPSYPICIINDDDDRRPLINESKAQCDDEDANGIARTRNNLRALADQFEAARAEIERLTGCMEIAGLQCFMRGGAPEQVAEHMRRVVDSWAENEAKLTAERDALQRKLDSSATIEAASQRTIATWEAAFVEWGKERERLTHRHAADLARWRQRNAEQAAGEARERDRMRPVVEAAESEVDQRGPLQPHERLRDPLCVAVDTYRAARDGEGGK